MSTVLDLYDIQGNIVKSYGRFKFSKARYIFYRVLDESKGRAFIRGLLPDITTAAPWGDNDLAIPPVTTNIAFTYSGLKNLGVPRKSLLSFPEEFVMGMKDRRDILGDDGPSAPEHWDKIWRDEWPVDIWVSINGQNLEAVETQYTKICALLSQSEGGVEQLIGHTGPDGQDNLPYQEASALYENGQPVPKEHFGYNDGITDPYFKGSGRNPLAVIGGGKPTRLPPDTIEGWEPFETGEFILGYRDESQEYPIAPIPKLLSHNGTFMVYRKLHENVGSFNRYLEEVGKDYPDGKEALAAKFSGRWRNGAPLALFPTEEKANGFMQRLVTVKIQRESATGEEKKRLDQEYYALLQQLVAFNYNDDIPGAKCPVGSHIRRVNPRGALEFGQVAFETPGALDNRRCILRRGLPYGKVEDPSRDDGDHGIIFMTVSASIARQFEFVQQQWINYGNDFGLSNDKDPLLGNQGKTPDGRDTGRMVIESTGGDKPPFFCANLPRFVNTRGGDYFFLPSLTSLRMIGQGIIDPT